MRLPHLLAAATLTLAAMLTGCNRDAGAPAGGATTATPSPAMPPASAASN